MRQRRRRASARPRPSLAAEMPEMNLRRRLRSPPAEIGGSAGRRFGDAAFRGGGCALAAQSGLGRCPLENPSRWGAAAKLRRGAGPSPLARRTGPAPPFSAGLAASASAPTLWRVATQLGSFDGYCRTGLPTASRRRSRPASTRRRRLEVTQASSSSYQRNMLGHKWLNRCLNPLRSSPGLEFENWAALAGWLSSWSAEPESLGTGPGSENASW